MVRHVLRRLEHPQGPSSMPVPAPLTAGGVPEALNAIRTTVAATFLRGEGIEIGALHQPLPLPGGAKATYVDRMRVADLRGHYPELADLPLIEPDVLDDGETLATFADASQDFVVANHFLEHCQNPIAALQTLLRVLKPGGVLFLAVPDRRFTFDVDRPPTPIEHLIRDYTDGPEWSRRQHFEEWVRLVNKQPEDRVDASVAYLMSIDYSIHFHVWRAVDLLEFIQVFHRFAAFELELFRRNGFESLLILRKS
jgi:SAM-dependent methyltransferase